MKNTRLAALAALTILSTPLLKADSVSASLGVSVRVMARAVVTIDSQPGQVVITPEDIKRGYVETSDPIVVRVRSNSRQGYRLEVSKSNEAFSAVELSFADISMRVSHESWIQRPYVAQGETMPMRARLILAPGTLPGIQPLAMSFTASAL